MSVSVPMMRVGEVWMIVDESHMDVRMAVWLHSGVARVVFVLVMLVVRVQVLVLERVVHVDMPMSFSKQ